LKDFGSFASKLSKGFGDVGQFLSKLNGALDKTLKGTQDGMQLAEKLGGFENQLKGTFDALTNLVKTGLQILETFKGFSLVAPRRLLDSQDAPPAASGGAAPPAAPAARERPPARLHPQPRRPESLPAHRRQRRRQLPLRLQVSRPRLLRLRARCQSRRSTGSRTTHESNTVQGGGGFTSQTDLRTSGGTTTQMKRGHREEDRH
jgi:hypothetical protein